jgi:hypothetical protein
MKKKIKKKHKKIKERILGTTCKNEKEKISKIKKRIIK